MKKQKEKAPWILLAAIVIGVFFGKAMNGPLVTVAVGGRGGDSITNLIQPTPSVTATAVQTKFESKTEQGGGFGGLSWEEYKTKSFVSSGAVIYGAGGGGCFGRCPTPTVTPEPYSRARIALRWKDADGTYCEVVRDEKGEGYVLKSKGGMTAVKYTAVKVSIGKSKIPAKIRQYDEDGNDVTGCLNCEVALNEDGSYRDTRSLWQKARDYCKSKGKQ